MDYEDREDLLGWALEGWWDEVRVALEKSWGTELQELYTALIKLARMTSNILNSMLGYEPKGS